MPPARIAATISFARAGAEAPSTDSSFERALPAGDEASGAGGVEAAAREAMM